MTTSPIAPKQASATVYLVEELGDARLLCDQLRRYVERAVSLIEKSSKKDHFFEVAGDIIQGIPEVTNKLHLALQAVALATNKLDYEEVRQDLQPAKVEELEAVLDDIRVRPVKRNSSMTPAQIAQQLTAIAKTARDTTRIPSKELLALIAPLEEGRKAPDAGYVAQELEKIAHTLNNPPEGAVGLPKALRVASVIRNLVAQEIPAVDTAKQGAGYEVKDLKEIQKLLEDIIVEAKKSKVKEIVDKAEKGLKTLKLAATIQPKPALQKLDQALSELNGLSASLYDLGDALYPSSLKDPIAKKMYKSLVEFETRIVGVCSDVEGVANAVKSMTKTARVKKASPSENPDLIALYEDVADKIYTCRVFTRQADDIIADIVDDASGIYYEGYRNKFLLRTRESLQEFDRYTGSLAREFEAAARDIRRSTRMAAEITEARYEEGVPADPTENMTEADAKQWKDNTDKYEDKFKAAALAPAPWETGAPANSGPAMTKVNNKVLAEEIAEEKKLSYGLSIFNGAWYVGTPEKLKSIGVADVLQPIPVDMPTWKKDDQGNLFLKVKVGGGLFIFKIVEKDNHFWLDMITPRKKTFEYRKPSYSLSDAKSMIEQYVKPLLKGEPVKEVFPKMSWLPAKTARYEEGVPADPTENMTEDDAKLWKDNTDKYEDKFKE